MNSYPNDEQYEDATIKSVRKGGDGWSFERHDGWSFFVPADSPIEPAPGMTVRLYGKGIGYRVRGLFLDGQEVFYRTEAEDDEKRECDTYGSDAADWLSRWDKGDSVWSIEMGGIGPGYEQAIQITAAETLRHLLKSKYDAAAWKDKEQWSKDREKIERALFDNETVGKLGLSGAQFGAALSLAINLYRDGPRGVMTHPDVKDRHIQVSRRFPG
jgi:hypothetical protein